MICNLPPYSRRDLEVWRSGREWRCLATLWLEQQVQVHGKHNFRRRKGGARGAKELGEEVLPLAKLLAAHQDFLDWEARFSPPGDRADAYLRQVGSSSISPLQIVCALDG